MFAGYASQETKWTIGIPSNTDWYFKSPEFPFGDVTYKVIVFQAVGHDAIFFVLRKGPFVDGPARVVRWKVGVKSDSGNEPRWIMTGVNKVERCEKFKGVAPPWEISLHALAAPGQCLTLVLRLSKGQTKIGPEAFTKSVISNRGFAVLKSAVLELKKDWDVVIRVKEKTYRAHRSILGSCSPVLHAMFSHNMVESRTGFILIDDCEPEAFEVLLVFIYTGKVPNFNSKNVMGTYYAADKYGLLELRKACSWFMLSNLSPGTICDVLWLAMRHNDKELLHHATQFFAGNVIEIISSRKWTHFARENPTHATEIYSRTAADI